VVLVCEVVAVRHVRADEVAEAAVDDRGLARAERDQVLPRDVVRMARVDADGDVLGFRMTTQCSSMCRWKGCSQPPPGLRGELFAVTAE
jgi:hypothetical protein